MFGGPKFKLRIRLPSGEEKKNKKEKQPSLFPQLKKRKKKKNKVVPYQQRPSRVLQGVIAKIPKIRAYFFSATETAELQSILH